MLGFTAVSEFPISSFEFSEDIVFVKKIVINNRYSETVVDNLFTKSTDKKKFTRCEVTWQI